MAPAAEVRTVAAFDFDGTLTRRDSLLPFLLRLCGPPAVALAAAREATSLLLAATPVGSRDTAKERLLGRLLAGRAMADVAPVVDDFACRLVETGLRPDTVARLRWHQRHGHHVLVVSASPAIYVGPVMSRLDVEVVLATGLEVDSADRLTGGLVGANVRGAEKGRRLREHLGDQPVRLFAYGDSAGDRELLAMADVALLVRGTAVPHRPN